MNNLFLFLIVSFLILLNFFVIISKRFTKRDRINFVILLVIICFSLAYYTEDYIALFMMSTITVVILITASSREFLHKNMQGLFRRNVYINEKEEFMFLPMWWFLFYSVITYGYVLFYRLIRDFF